MNPVPDVPELPLVPDEPDVPELPLVPDEPFFVYAIVKKPPIVPLDAIIDVPNINLLCVPDPVMLIDVTVKIIKLPLSATLYT